jgi:hypothetical protein
MSREILEVARAVEAVEAKQRVPADTPRAITFFSKNDEWIFTAVMDNDVCFDCRQYENKTFTGDMLRSLFPFLEIQDLETILPHVHPNCRCHLDRTLYFGDIGVEK